MKRSTQPHDNLRRLIQARSLTAQGFMLADAQGMESCDYASRHACRMVLAGSLFRVKVKGHPLHYLHSQIAADALAATLTPRARMPKPISPATLRIVQMREVMAAKAATPGGASFTDVEPLGALISVFSKHTRSLIAAGDLFVGKASGHRLHYFATLAAAQDWVTRTLPTRMTRQARPKATKPAKPSKPAKAALRHIVLRKPVTPPAPRFDAPVVYPPGYRHSSRMMHPPRNQVITHSFIHGGMGQMQAGR